MPTTGSDTIIGTPEDDVIRGLGGDDSIDGGFGNDSIYGNDGADQLYGNAGSDFIDGGAGSDQIFGQVGDDSILGGTESDWLYGENGRDYLDGGAGDDRLDGGAGDDTVVGGSGNDTIWNYSSVFQNAISGNDALYGGDGDDSIYVERYGGENGDYVQIFGGAGNDTLSAWSSSAAFFFDAGSGNDYIIAGFSGLAMNNLHIVSGQGSDVVSIRSGATSTGLVIYDFTPGTNGDRIDLEPMLASLSGWDSQSNPFGTGHLRLVQSGADALLQTQTGHTIIRFKDVSGDSFVPANLGFAIPRVLPVSHNGSTPFYATDAGDWIVGHTGNDFLVGLGGNDTIFGLAGNDVLYGWTGADLVEGGQGADFIIGGDGADTLIGGAGGDWMGGGAGADVYRYLATGDSNATGGFDAVAQFETGIDRIDLSAIDANTAAGGDQAFTIGALAAGQAGRLQITTTAGYTLVEGDVNGDGIADIAFFVWSETGGVAAPAALSAGDFVL